VPEGRISFGWFGLMLLALALLLGGLIPLAKIGR
jgi:hypothetical protein